MFEMLQKKESPAEPKPIAAAPNRTGIPTQLKRQIEATSKLSLDDVKIHYSSAKPAEWGALAYTQGSQVYLGPGQQQHLGHELGHVIQQKQGRVPTQVTLGAHNFNLNPALEQEADRIAGGFSQEGKGSAPLSANVLDDDAPVQMRIKITYDQYYQNILGKAPANPITAADAKQYYNFAGFHLESVFLTQVLNPNLPLVEANRRLELLHTDAVTINNCQKDIQDLNNADIAIRTALDAVPFVPADFTTQVDEFISCSNAIYSSIPDLELYTFLETAFPLKRKCGGNLFYYSMSLAIIKAFFCLL